MGQVLAGHVQRGEAVLAQLHNSSELVRVGLVEQAEQKGDRLVVVPVPQPVQRRVPDLLSAPEPDVVALLGGLALLWSACRVAKNKKPDAVNSIQMLLWFLPSANLLAVAPAAEQVERTLSKIVVLVHHLQDLVLVCLFYHEFDKCVVAASARHVEAVSHLVVHCRQHKYLKLQNCSLLCSLLAVHWVLQYSS